MQLEAFEQLELSPIVGGLDRPFGLCALGLISVFTAGHIFGVVTLGCLPIEDQSWTASSFIGSDAVQAHIIQPT